MINLEPESYLFELDITLRDSKGNPTGKRKIIRSNSAHDIWAFWNRFRGKPKRKKKNEEQSEQAKKEQKRKKNHHRRSPVNEEN